jgi:hypothetical protein
MKAPKKPDFSKGIEKEDLEQLCYDWGKYSTENPTDENISIWYRLTDWLNLLKFADKTERQAVKEGAISIRDLTIEIKQLNHRIGLLKHENEISEFADWSEKIQELEIELQELKDEHEDEINDLLERDVSPQYLKICMWLAFGYGD